MSPALTLEITRTWDGSSIPDGERITVRLVGEPHAVVIHVDAPLHGDPPASGPPGPTWGLWDHEVVELFVLGADERYTEIEIAPSGHHLVLQLQGCRNVVARELPLDLRTESGDGRWTAQARIARALLPPGPHRVNAYGIHGLGEDRRYLACTPVPGPAPDFHRLDRFPSVMLP
jgi:hypothetical protein